jgi:hypothetical protein
LVQLAASCPGDAHNDHELKIYESRVVSLCEDVFCPFTAPIGPKEGHIQVLIAKLARLLIRILEYVYPQFRRYHYQY